MASTPGLLSLSETAKRFAKRPPNYKIIEFVTGSQGLGITSLFPAQRFMLKVFEKEELDNKICDVEVRDQFNETVLYTLTEYQFYEYLRSEGRFSLDYDQYCASPITQIMLSMGRRASKSTVIGLWVSYKLYQILCHDHPQLFFNILPNDQMNVTLTALGEDNAQKLLGKLSGILRGAPFFQPFMLEPPTSSALKLWTAHDIATMREKQIKIGASAQTNSITINAQANSPGVRGENNIFVILEEFAHFNTAKGSSRDKPLDAALHESLVPSVAGFKTPDGQPFGKALIISSPNGKRGKFYEELDAAYRLGTDSYTLAIQAPTWEINPSVSPAFLRAAYNKNPASYDQEYGAKLLEGGVSWLRDIGAVYASVVKSHDGVTPAGRIDRVYFMGVDFALSNDGTAVAIAHYEPHFEHPESEYVEEAFAYNDPDTTLWMPGPDGGRYVVDFVDQVKAGEGLMAHRKTLLIEEVLDWIEDLMRRYPIQHGVFDQWAGVIIQQLIQQRGLSRLKMMQFTELGNDAMYKLFSSLLHEGRLKLPNNKPFLRELLSLQVENRAHGIIKIEAPAGLHDDRFDAVARAIYLAHAFQNKNYVLAGQELHFKFGSPVQRSVANFGASRTEVALRKMQEQHHGAALNLRNPKSMSGRFTGRMRGR